MGEVWRARDSRLGRTVAIKVLPKEFAQDRDLRRRFEREARIISKLNHPNICTLHDVGEGYLVMEFVEGESLAERLRKGPLPIRDALRYGAEIALALDQAHRVGVVHRDLKPGNVMVTKAGSKLLDFGLARSEAHPGPDDRTVTAPLTEAGMILGTVPYMAPEQLEAKGSDARTDIFALGAVLYEMVTGQRAFQGASRASLIASILNAEPPPISSRQPLTPRSLEHLILRCLAKNPDERWQSASDVAGELRWIAESLSNDVALVAATAPRAKDRKTVTATLVLGGLLLAGAAGWFIRSKTASDTGGVREVPRVVRLTWDLHSSGPAISPDGKMLVYEGKESDAPNANWDVFVKRIGGENATNLTKDSGVDHNFPTFSPDGQRIAFQMGLNSTGIFVMGATGESLRRLTTFGYRPAWSPDGKTIAFTSLNGEGWAWDALSSLWIVDVVTGTTSKVYDGDAVRPFWSRSGKRIGFDGRRKGMAGERALSTIALTGGEPVEVASTPGIGWMPGAWTPGWIWYVNPEKGPPGIWKVRVDETTGKALSFAEPVFRSTQEVTLHLSSTPSGSRIVFSVFSRDTDMLRWEVDPVTGRISGEPRKVLSGSRPLYMPVPSPDGTWIAGKLIEQSNEFREDLAIVNEASGEIRRLTDDVLRESSYAWSPDGSWLYFCVAMKNGSELWRIKPDGSGRERVLEKTPAGEVLNVLVSPGGKSFYVEGGRLHEPFLAETGTGNARFVPLPPLSGETVFAASSWSADGRRIAGRTRKPGGDFDDRLVVLDVVSQKYRAVEGVKIGRAARFLPDSRRLLMVGRGGEVTIHDIESSTTASGGSVLPDAYGFSLSRDGKAIYSSRERRPEDVWMLDFTQGPGR